MFKMAKTSSSGKKYHETDIAECLRMIKSGISIRRACKRFNIPRSTIIFRAGNKWSGKTQKGKPTALTPVEEDGIVRWITRMARKGFPITKDRLTSAVSRFISENPRHKDCKMKAGKLKLMKKWYDTILLILFV